MPDQGAKTMRRPTGAASSSVNAARASPSEPSRTRVGVRSRNEPFKLAILAAPLAPLISAQRTYVIEFALRLVDEGSECLQTSIFKQSVAQK